MSNLGKLSLQEAAKEAAGNWRKFNSFVWYRDDVEDRDNWGIIYTHNRDSRLLTQSNATVINKELTPFSEGDDPDVVFESHTHWAVGHIDGFSIRVFKNGEITDAFKKCHQLYEKLAGYPTLDEEHYSEMESDATFQNVCQAGRGMEQKYNLPEGWENDVTSWLYENTNALENTDDQGGWPEDSDLKKAFKALGYKMIRKQKAT